MAGKLGESVSTESFLTVLVCLFLVGYFIYKEWPEFKKRVSGSAKKEAETESEEKTMDRRMERVEQRVSEINDMLSRDYIRLNTVEKLSRANAKAIGDSLEERRILMEGLLACLKCHQDGHANGETADAIKNINTYLNKQAHTNQQVEHDAGAPMLNPNI